MTDELALHAALALCGGLGAGARHALTALVTRRPPLSTLAVNVVGCFALGVGRGLLPPDITLAGLETGRLVGGFCGGFTTFSSFAWQTLGLHRDGTPLHALGNVAVSLLGCLAAYGAGLSLTAP